MPTPPTTLVQKKIEELKKYLSEEQTVAQKEGTTWQEKEKLVLVNILEISKNMLESLANTNQPTNTYKSIESYIDQIRGQLGNLSDVTRTNFKNTIAALLISIDAAIMPPALVGASGKPRSQPTQTTMNSHMRTIPIYNESSLNLTFPPSSPNRQLQPPNTTFTSVPHTNSNIPSNEPVQETITPALQQKLTTLESLLATKTIEQQELQQTVLDLQYKLNAHLLEQQRLQEKQSVTEKQIQDLSTKLPTANNLLEEYKSGSKKENDKIDQLSGEVRKLQDRCVKLESTSQEQALQVNQLDKKINDLTVQNSALQEKVTPLALIIEQLQTQVDAANKSLETTTADNEEIRREMEELKKQLDPLQKDNQFLQLKLEKETKELKENIEENKKTSDDEITRLGQTIHVLSSELNKKTTDLEEKVENSTKRIEDLQENLAAAKRFEEQKQGLQQQIDENKKISDDAIAKLNQKIDQFDRSNEQTNTVIQERNTQIAQLNTEVAALNVSNKTQQATILKLQQELYDLKTRLAPQTSDIQTDNARLKEILEQILANKLALQARIQALEEQQISDTPKQSNSTTEQTRDSSPAERLERIVNQYSTSNPTVPANVVTATLATDGEKLYVENNPAENGSSTDIASPLTQKSLIIYNQNEQKFLFNKAKITELIPSLSPKKDGALDKTQPIDVETTQEQVSFEGDKRDDNVFTLLQGMSKHNDEIKKYSANFANNQHLLCAAVISVPDNDSMLRVLSKIYNDEVKNPEDITVKVLIECNNSNLNKETEEMIRLHNTIVTNINKNKIAKTELEQIKEKLKKADSDNVEKLSPRPGF
jgi:hypothetical protein